MQKVTDIEKKSKRITANVTQEVQDLVYAAAKKDCMSISKFITDAITSAANNSLNGKSISHKEIITSRGVMEGIDLTQPRF